MNANAWSPAQLSTQNKGELRGFLRGERAVVERELRDKRRLAAQLSADIHHLEERLDQINEGLDLL